MIRIVCKKEIDQVAGRESPVLLRAARAELSQLQEALDFDGEGDRFHLDDKGYRIVCLEPYESKASLLSLGLRYPFQHVEFVELHTLGGIPYYRIMLYYDNEDYAVAFALRDTQADELEQWLSLHATVEGGGQE